MRLEFDPISEEVINDHCYNAWIVKGNWQEVVAKEYNELRTHTKFPIEPICFDGLEFSVEVIKERIAANTIPRRKGGNFDVTRSDFGEVISYLVLEQNYSTKFGYKGTRDRELIHLPGRGIDGVGIETGTKLRLVLTETKLSSQKRTPPAVVDIQDDSLRNQHLAHISDMETSRKVWDVARRTTSSDLQALFLAAALLFEERKFDRLDVVTCCVLVRPQNMYSPQDFGTFKLNPSDFSPGKIRFLVVCVPTYGNNIEDVIDQWYQKLNEGKLD